MNTPTLIDLPDPPSNPDTPTEAPGTPNSATTSLSALSTTAIKDGHRGAAFAHHHRTTPSSNTLEAERADRISRLAGLERVSAGRPQSTVTSGAAGTVQLPGYFDAAGNPVYTTKMSTVGTASQTGSTGGRTTTWASGSTKDDDQMSMDANSNYRDLDDRDRFSTGALDEDDGMSDDTSLVGFGEGAGSTVSGPTYSRSNLQRNLGSARDIGNASAAPASTNAEQQRRDVRAIDGLADDTSSGWVDTAARGGAGVPSNSNRGSGVEAAERIIRERIDDGVSQKPLGSPDENGIGKFYFEERK